MGICQVNCYKTHNELTLYPLGKCPFAPSVRDDFIRAAGHVSRRKLNRLVCGPYQRALLRRGVSKRVDVEDERIPIPQQLMEYAGAVGMMLIDKITYVNGQVEAGMGRAMNRIEREVTRLDESLGEQTTLVAEAQGDIETLIADARRKTATIDRLERLVDELLERVTVLEGRQDNPIEIPDSSTPLPIRIVIDDAHRLVPIEELVPSSEDGEEGVNLDEVFQVNPDLEEIYRVRPGEAFEEGEMILDVLRRRNARAEEVPKYVDPPAYNDPGYTSDH